jgi:hypothetical protein
MDFNRKHDYSDQYAFLPDNNTIGTKEYFKKKYGDKFPEYIYDIMEAEHRIEYSEEDKANVIKAIARLQQEQNEKLVAEYEARCEEGKDEEGGGELKSVHILDDQQSNQLPNDILKSDISE